MSAEDVFEALLEYELSTVKNLLKFYPDNQSMISALRTYQKRDQYHGHGSGGNGDGLHQGATKNRKDAVAWLESRKPNKADMSTKVGRSEASKQAEAANRHKIGSLKAIITANKTKTIPQIRDALAKHNAAYSDFRDIEESLRSLKLEKDAARKLKNTATTS
jgi:hypothetical protein